MVLHMPSNGGRPVLISLPRDSYVPIPGHGYDKINAAYAYGGPRLLAETVQNVTGLRIDHFMSIGFGGFVRVVDAIGGVRLCLKAPLVDPAAGLHLHKGCQTLNGARGTRVRPIQAQLRHPGPAADPESADLPASAAAQAHQRGRHRQSVLQPAGGVRCRGNADGRQRHAPVPAAEGGARAAQSDHYNCADRRWLRDLHAARMH